MMTARLARGPPSSACASNTSPVADANAPESSATTTPGPSARNHRATTQPGLTKLDLRRLVRVQFLAPGVHAEHVVDGEDVDVLDALGGELVVSLNVPGDLLNSRNRQRLLGPFTTAARPTHRLGTDRRKRSGDKNDHILPLHLAKVELLIRGIDLDVDVGDRSAHADLAGRGECRECRVGGGGGALECGSEDGCHFCWCRVSCVCWEGSKVLL